MSENLLRSGLSWAEVVGGGGRVEALGRDGGGGRVEGVSGGGADRRVEGVSGGGADRRVEGVSGGGADRTVEGVSGGRSGRSVGVSGGRAVGRVESVSGGRVEAAACRGDCRGVANKVSIECLCPNCLRTVCHFALLLRVLGFSFYHMSLPFHFNKVLCGISLLFNHSTPRPRLLKFVHYICQTLLSTSLHWSEFMNRNHYIVAVLRYVLT